MRYGDRGHHDICIDTGGLRGRHSVQQRPWWEFGLPCEEGKGVTNAMSSSYQIHYCEWVVFVDGVVKLDKTIGTRILSKETYILL